MIEPWKEKLEYKDAALTPAANNFFELGHGKLLDEMEIFHTIMVNDIFVGKNVQPDIQPTISVLSGRFRSPIQSDWDKLRRLVKYLNGSCQKHLVLCIN